MRAGAPPMVILAATLCVATPAQGSPIVANSVTVCPASAHPTPPTFADEACRTVPFWRADPQGRQIWIKATVSVARDRIDASVPLGVFVSAKAATEVFLNGVRLGRNGRPAATQGDEIPGRMDAVFAVPRSGLRPGDNDIVVRMSSHYGFLRFGFPVHYIAIDDYADPVHLLLSRYWPSLIPFGALIAGFLTFAAAAVAGGWQRQAILSGLICVLAAGQLFVEVYRGLVPYTYPVHEWRMLLIVALSLGFGLSLAAQVVWTYIQQRPIAAWAIIAVTALLTVWINNGYDSKAAAGVMVPTVGSIVVAMWAAARRKSQAWSYLAALTLFAGSIVVFTDLFLDTLFFYEVAVLVLVLFAMQSTARERERTLLIQEQARSKQLAAALEQAAEPPPSASLRVAGAGTLDIVDAGTIMYCKAADDYVELHLRDGRHLLHHGTLTRIEDDLPATFLRVHRSYLVNTQFVRTLRRATSGVGTLVLMDETEVPVSRRIMPKVRNALS